jgi:pyruvate dehydrogenase E1 component beta subunit
VNKAVTKDATLTMTYREACRQAIREALTSDPRTFVMGEDVGLYGGCYAVTKGLLDEFGPSRIRDTPLSESAFVGAGIGAAMAGLRPIVEIMTCNFSLLALDQIINNAATIPHMSGGQFAVPLVIRMATGAGASSPPSTPTAWRAGTAIFRASRCWRPARWRMPATCSSRRWPTRTRC